MYKTSQEKWQEKQKVGKFSELYFGQQIGRFFVKFLLLMSQIIWSPWQSLVRRQILLFWFMVLEGLDEAQKDAFTFYFDGGKLSPQMAEPQSEKKGE